MKLEASVRVNLKNQNHMMDKYKRKRNLGTGGFATVDLCIVNNGTIPFEEQTLVAVKRIEDVENITRAKEEAKILLKLDHRFIIKYLDNFIDSSGHFCIVMEYCEAGTLREWLTNLGNPLEEENIWRVIWQLSSALTFLHGQEPPILHNDLKPSNILCKTNSAKDGIDMKISDFGLSDILGKTPSATYYHSTLPNRGFTWLYASPEVLRRESHIGTSADMWSLGAVIVFIANDRTHLFESKEAVLSWTGGKTPLGRELNQVLHDLVLSLLHPDKHLRITAHQTLNECSSHPERF